MLGVLFEFIFELLGEILIQFIVEIGLELGFEGIKEVFKREKQANPVLSVLGLLIFGAIIGLVSVWVFPHRIISKYRMSGISLILAPVCVGLILHFFGNWRRSQGKYTTNLATFWGGVSFALALSLVRWLIIRQF